MITFYCPTFVFSPSLCDGISNDWIQLSLFALVITLKAKQCSRYSPLLVPKTGSQHCTYHFSSNIPGNNERENLSMFRLLILCSSLHILWYVTLRKFNLNRWFCFVFGFSFSRAFYPPTAAIIESSNNNRWHIYQQELAPTCCLVVVIISQWLIAVKKSGISTKNWSLSFNLIIAIQFLICYIFNCN